mgnify:FL=1
MKRFQRIVILAALTLAMLTGCGAVSRQSSTSTAVVGSTAVVENVAVDTDGLFSQRDLEQSWDESTAVRIELTGDTASSDSDAVQIDGGTVTITSEGVYVLSGTLSNGSITVDAGDEDKVQLVLNGVSVTSSDFAAIYAKNADKVFVTLAENTENTLVNENGFTEIDDNHVDAVIFSKCDLTLNGAGRLTVTSPAGHGIVSKDELTITGGIYTITASGHGLTGKGSVAIAAGSFVIDSGKDGIHAEDEDDSEAGFIYLSDGDFTITAQGDGISASGMLEIAGGNYNITTGGGSAASGMKGGDSQLEPGAGQNGAAQGGQPGEPPAQSGQTDSKAPPEKPEEDKNPQIDVNDAEQEKDFTESNEVSSDSTSQKGLKSSTSVIVQAGNFTLDTADDGVHSNGTVTITGGEWTIRTGDDGIHADGALTITGGSFSIPYCYEGIEGSTITINGGTFDITANDDGLNAADGTSNAPGMANENCWIEINDGEFTIVSDGDSIDSNGDLTINGGTLDLTCNGNGNTAIDTDGTYTNNGGDVTTNDGSENGSGEMGSFGGQGNTAAGGPGGQMGQPGGGGQMPDSAPGQNDQNGTAST